VAAADDDRVIGLLHSPGPRLKGQKNHRRRGRRGSRRILPKASGAVNK
jgi:hypothetical protein